MVGGRSKVAKGVIQRQLSLVEDRPAARMTWGGIIRHQADVKSLHTNWSDPGPNAPRDKMSQFNRKMGQDGMDFHETIVIKSSSPKKS